MDHWDTKLNLGKRERENCGVNAVDKCISISYIHDIRMMPSGMVVIREAFMQVYSALHVSERAMTARLHVGGRVIIRTDEIYWTILYAIILEIIVCESLCLLCFQSKHTETLHDEWNVKQIMESWPKSTLNCKGKIPLQACRGIFK